MINDVHIEKKKKKSEKVKVGVNYPVRVVLQRIQKLSR